MRRVQLSVLIGLLSILWCAGAVMALTKDDVRKLGYLRCGVSTGLPGFSVPDEDGNWSGMDVDICRAVAVAVLGDTTKVKFIPLAEDEQFTALQAGDVDLLSRNSSWTFTNDTSLALNFAGIAYYDGQGFLVARKLKIKKSLDLSGASLCVVPGSAQELNAGRFFTRNKMEYKPVFFNSFSEAVKGFKEDKCSVLSHKKSILYGVQSHLQADRKAFVLPEVIAREPLSPVVRQGDDSWFNIVKWTLYLLINAEEEGVSSTNVERLKAKASSDESGTGVLSVKGTGLGLADDWAIQVIRQVGNYQEIFERNLGEKSSLKIQRGLNALWSRGGLLYAPPFH